MGIQSIMSENDVWSQVFRASLLFLRKKKDRLQAGERPQWSDRVKKEDMKGAG